MIFWNVSRGNKYEITGNILYKYLKQKNHDLEIKYIDTKDINQRKYFREIYNYNDYIYAFNDNLLDLIPSEKIITKDYRIIQFENKRICYEYFSKYMVDSEFIDNSNISKLLNIFNKYNKNIYVHILSDNVSMPSGGENSYILNKENINKFIFNYFIQNKNKKLFKISPKINIQKNISQHIIIFKDKYMFLDETNQIIDYDGVTYLGNIYPSNLISIEKIKIKNIINDIYLVLKQYNARGIIGFDFMIDYDGVIYLTEMNIRKMTSIIPMSILSDIYWNISIPVLEYYSCSDYNLSEINLEINNKNFWIMEYLYKEKYKKEVISNNIKDILNLFKNSGTYYFDDLYHKLPIWLKFKINYD